MRSIISVFLVFLLKLLSKTKLSINVKLNLRSFKRILNSKAVHSNIRGGYLGGQVSYGDGFNVFGSPEIYGKINIGNYTTICGPGTRVCSSVNSIFIGNYCSIASNVIIQEFYHRMDLPTTYGIFSSVFHDNDATLQKISKGDIVIEDDVWVGSNVVILSGIHIGRGAVIGAGSVVTKNVPPYSIVGGNPAKFIRKRFEQEYISYLENSRWWEWSREKVLNNKSFFMGNVYDIEK